MRSTMIEFLREGNPDEGTLVKDACYLVTMGPTRPMRKLEMPLGYRDFRRYLSRLRYQSSESEQTKALAELSAVITDILQPPEPEPRLELQLDLVVTVAEIGALPFEAACGAGDVPLFVDPDRVVVPTRRVRGEFVDSRQAWPSKPRVLFAHAAPGWVDGPAVPAEDHLDALRDALRPWLEILPHIPSAAIPDENSVLVTLPDASLEDIRGACVQASADGAPFTHVHILAHGLRYADDPLLPDDYCYGLGLSSAQQKPTPATELADALAAQQGLPVVVSLAVCDGGSQVNSAFSGESLAQTLHRAGIPVVLASQLPLTFPGSTLLTRTFYDALLGGQDVRLALHRTRVVLYQQAGDAGHDWLSFVAYVQLPEGYAEQLPLTALQRELASLETASRWADHIEENKIRNDLTFDHVTKALTRRIDVLSHSLDQLDVADCSGMREENTGLLGSANKRLAHLLFVRGDGDAAQWLERGREALAKSRAWYLEGYQHNASAHWNGVQYLCLEAVLEGKIDPPWRWHAVIDAAEASVERSSKEIWALGTLAELHLLAPLAGPQSALKAAGEALAEMKRRVTLYCDDDFPLKSARRQLACYTQWWTEDNGFFPELGHDLAADARHLRQVLDEAEPGS